MSLRLEKLVVTLVEIHEDHAVPDNAANGLRCPARPAQAPVGTDVLVVLTGDQDRLTEQSDHQRIATERNCCGEVDEVPPRAVGRGHFATEGAVVGRKAHATAPLGAVSQVTSVPIAAIFGAISQVTSIAVVAEDFAGWVSQVTSPGAERAQRAAATTAVVLSARTILLMADLHLF